MIAFGSRAAGAAGRASQDEECGVCEVVRAYVLLPLLLDSNLLSCHAAAAAAPHF